MKKRVSIIILLAIALVAGYVIYKAKFEQPIPSALDRKLVLAKASLNATERQKTAQFERIVRASVETNSIDISACSSNPMVASVAKGSDVTFVNNDQTDHTIRFSPSVFFVIPKASSKTVKAEFGKFPGSYDYICDNSTSTAGIILLK